jgi:hypothetical protein
MQKKCVQSLYSDKFVHIWKLTDPEARNIGIMAFFETYEKNADSPYYNTNIDSSYYNKMLIVHITTQI